MSSGNNDKTRTVRPKEKDAAFSSFDGSPLNSPVAKPVEVSVEEKQDPTPTYKELMRKRIEGNDTFTSFDPSPHPQPSIDINAVIAQQKNIREEAEAQKLAQEIARIKARLTPTPLVPQARQRPLTPVVPKTTHDIAMEAFIKESGIGGIKESGISQREQDRNTILTNRLRSLKNSTLSSTDKANDIIDIMILDIQAQAKECETSADLVKFGLNIDKIVGEVIGKDQETVQFTNFKTQLNTTINARANEIGGIETQKEKPKSKLSSAFNDVKEILKGAAKSVSGAAKSASKKAKKVFKKNSASISK